MAAPRWTVARRCTVAVQWPGMDADQHESRRPGWRTWMDFNASATAVALILSLLSFYRSYFYVSQHLEVTVTEVSYGTNRGELYMTVAFSNAGNRDAAVLRVEPALWSQASNQKLAWVPLIRPVAAEIPLVAPRPPLVVK